MGILDGLAGAALGGIGSVATSLLGNSSNIQLAREQREWDYKMWKENNEYNTPLNQMKRLRDAGINPGLAMSNGLMGNGLSSQTAGGQTAPTVDFSPIAQGLQQSVDLYQQKRMQDAQIDKLHEETVNQSIKNRYENQRQIIEIDKLLSDKGLSDATREYYQNERDRLIEENKWIDKRNSSQIHKTMMEAFQAQENGRYTRTMNRYHKIVNQYAHQHQQKIIRNLDAEYSNIMSAALANDASAAASYASAALSNASKQGVNIDNETKKRIQENVVSKAFEEVQMIRDDNERKWLKEMHSAQGKGGEMLPHPGHVYFSEEGYKNFQNKRKFRH